MFECTPNQFRWVVKKFNELYDIVTDMRGRVSQEEFENFNAVVIRIAGLINEQMLLRGEEGLQIYEEFGKITGLLKKPDQINAKCAEVYSELIEKIRSN